MLTDLTTADNMIRETDHLSDKGKKWLFNQIIDLKFNKASQEVRD